MPKKLTYKFVKDSFEKSDYTLISNYINCKTHLDYICDKGHKGSIIWNNWNKGVRCPDCYGNSKPKRNYIIEQFVKENYILISKYYNNSYTKLDYICPNGHVHNITWSAWKQGYRCGRCKGNIEVKFEDIKKSFEYEGYKLISEEYINDKSKLISTCPNGHKYEVSCNNWKNGKRCPKCKDHGTSKFEQQVKYFIAKQNIDFIENDRTLIKNQNTNCMLELDILFSCKTKAIECNGVYWHNRPEAIEKDKIKNDQCKKLGINLLTITDEEWKLNQAKCKDKINNLLIN